MSVCVWWSGGWIVEAGLLERVSERGEEEKVKNEKLRL